MSRTPAAPHPDPGQRADRRRKAEPGLAPIGRSSWLRRGGGRGNAHGAVTAEFAVALPAVLLLLAMLLAGAAGGVTQLRLEEAALAGARALARGEDPAVIEATVKTLAGASATATVAADGEWLSVTVADRVGGPLGATVPWTLTAKATTRNERPAAGVALPPFVLAAPAPASPALSPSMSAPTLPSPTLPSPTLPSPALPAPTLPSPPAPAESGATSLTASSRTLPGKPGPLQEQKT